MRYRSKMERRAEQEEELFTRAPLTRVEKKKGKHLLKSRNGYCFNLNIQVKLFFYKFVR